jgi:hypothetical protein
MRLAPISWTTRQGNFTILAKLEMKADISWIRWTVRTSI